MKKKLAVLLLIIFISPLPTICQLTSNNIEVKNRYKTIDSLAEKTKLYDKKFELLIKGNKELYLKLDSTRTYAENLKKEFNNLEIIWDNTSSLTKIGAIALLIGLLIEIMGATLLAGNHLVAEQKDVFSLRPSQPLLDLSLTDVKQEPRIDFLGTLGGLLLFVGFVFQFTGTIFVLALPLWWLLFLFSLALIPGLGIIYYLMGQNPEQTRNEKLNFLWNNIRRNFFLSKRKLKCDYCLKKIEMSDVQIWWLQESNSKEHPYLFPPYNWHIGHHECLTASGWYDDKHHAINEQNDETLFKKDAYVFLEKIAPETTDWWNKYHEYWTMRRRKKSKFHAQQEDFISIMNKIDTKQYIKVIK